MSVKLHLLFSVANVLLTKLFHELKKKYVT